MKLSSAVMLLIILATPCAAGAAPTPVPGGAHQLQAIAGPVGKTLWNGTMRLQITEFREATPEEIQVRGNGNYWTAGSRGMFLSGIVRNGCSKAESYGLDFSLADKDDVVVKIIGNFFQPVGAGFSLEPAAAGKFTAVFPIDPSYKPTKLIVTGPLYGCGGYSDRPKAFRIALKSS